MLEFDAEFGGAVVSGAAITAVVLTRDEERVLARCIESLRFCDRIVVLDSGSTDDTVGVAQRCGAEVIVHRPEGQFLITVQRNWILDNLPVDSHWVLFVDADEVVPSELAEAIRRETQGADDVVTAFELAPRYLFWGRWLRFSSGYPNWHPRLIRRGRARLTGGVWESVQTEGRVARLLPPYDHYANSSGFDGWLEKHRRYARFEASTISQGDAAAQRGGSLRSLTYRLWPIRPLARFAWILGVRGGILDGAAGLAYATALAFYEFMVVMYVIEDRLRASKTPL